MGTKFIKGNNYNIPKNEKVKVEEYTEDRILVKHSAVNNNLSGYTKNDERTYYDPKTRTLKQYKKNPKKSNTNLNRSLNHTLRPLLENNFFGGKNEVFVTLTYAEPMFALSTLTIDYDRFWRRLCNNFRHLDLACVYIKEMQEKRQSWHMHSIIKELNNKNLNIPFDLLKQMWGLGNVWINRISETWDYSNYQINIENEMSSHLLFGSAHSYNKVIDYMCKAKSKKDVFPSGAKIYGNKGKLKGPVITTMTYEEAYNTKLQDSQFINQDTTLVIDEDNNCILNCIQKEYWIKNKPQNPYNGGDLK